MKKKELKLEKEAKAFTRKKLTTKKPPLPAGISARDYFAGQAMAYFMSQSSHLHWSDIKKESYKVADYMLED